MPDEMPPAATGPILLCFDGSDDAAHAIATAGAMLEAHEAVVLSVWERAPSWEPYDPATVLTAPVSRLASNALGLDEIARDDDRERVKAGAELASRAGFNAQERIAEGKPWRVICDVAKELDASLIVLGARGLSRVQSALLGSVSSAVVHHAGRPVLIVPHVRVGRGDSRRVAGEAAITK
jgi:nucleotide-binding universal stress UspA family protein